MGLAPSIHCDGDNGRVRLIHNRIAADSDELYSSDENRWLNTFSVGEIEIHAYD